MTRNFVLSGIILLCTGNPGFSQPASYAIGKLLFQTNCSRCHGMKGTGGEGPNLALPVLNRAATDEAFSSIIENGIAGTGMPSFWTFDKDQRSQIIRYVRSLSAIESVTVAGDVEKGKIVFKERNCGSCHILNGAGSSLGPDLTQIGLKRGTSYLLETIRKPGSKKILDEKGYILYLVVEVELQNGKTIKGIRVNEDTFTLQLKDSSSKLYSFRKKDLKSIRTLPNESQMPDFSAALSKEEIQNIAAFLSSQK